MLSLEEFGASTLEAEAQRYSVNPADLGRQAARYFLSDLDSGRMALRVPPFAREGGGGKAAYQLSVDLDTASWGGLEAEAERQGVSVDTLLEHAIMYFLADLDSGRVERRILEDETA
jgi:hypothetical protein